MTESLILADGMTALRLIVRAKKPCQITDSSAAALLAEIERLRVDLSFMREAADQFAARWIAAREAAEQNLVERQLVDQLRQQRAAALALIPELARWINACEEVDGSILEPWLDQLRAALGAADELTTGSARVCSKCGTAGCVEDAESGWYDDPPIVDTHPMRRSADEPTTGLNGVCEPCQIRMAFRDEAHRDEWWGEHHDLTGHEPTTGGGSDA